MPKPEPGHPQGHRQSSDPHIVPPRLCHRRVSPPPGDFSLAQRCQGAVPASPEGSQPSQHLQSLKSKALRTKGAGQTHPAGLPGAAASLFKCKLVPINPGLSILKTPGAPAEPEHGLVAPADATSSPGIVTESRPPKGSTCFDGRAGTGKAKKKEKKNTQTTLISVSAAMQGILFSAAQKHP